MGTLDLRRAIFERYRTLDSAVRTFRIRSGLRCPKKCGVCCESPQVEASALECLPLAWEIFHRGEEEHIASAIEARQREEALQCVLFAGDSDSPKCGKCSYYRFRPLVCRLFGYTSRRNKSGWLELCVCRVMREETPAKALSWRDQDISPIDPPVYQDWFLQIAGLDPATGFRLLPINAAIQAALDHVYWQRPRGRSSRRYHKAA